MVLGASLHVVPHTPGLPLAASVMHYHMQSDGDKATAQKSCRKPLLLCASADMPGISFRASWEVLQEAIILVHNVQTCLESPSGQSSIEAPVSEVGKFCAPRSRGELAPPACTPCHHAPAQPRLLRKDRDASRCGSRGVVHAWRF